MFVVYIFWATSNKFLYGVMPGFIFSTAQSVITFPNLEVLKSSTH